MEYLLLLLTVLLYVSQNFFCARYSKLTRSSENVSSFVYTFYLGLVLAFITLALNRFNFSASLLTAALALSTAVCLAVYYFSLVNGARLGSYMLLMVFALFGGIIIPTAYDCISSKTMLPPLKLAGVVMTLAAVVLFNTGGEKKQKDAPPETRKVTPLYIICCILIFVSNGVYGTLIAQQQIVEAGAHEREMLILTYLFASLISLTAVLITKNKGPLKAELAIGKSAALSFIAAAFSATAALNCLVAVLGTLGSAVVYTVNNGGNLFFVALLSRIVFKEHFTPNKIAGTVIIIISIIMLCV